MNFDMPSRKNIHKMTDGYSFAFVSENIVEGNFQCTICLGKGKYAYVLKRNDGDEIKAGKDCLKHCGLVAPQGGSRRRVGENR